jgi:hypothetical protein
MFIEYRGTFYTNADASAKNVNMNVADLSSLYLVAKNKDVPNIEQLVMMYQASKLYGCQYASHATDMNTLTHTHAHAHAHAHARCCLQTQSSTAS